MGVEGLYCERAAEEREEEKFRALLTARIALLGCRMGFMMAVVMIKLPRGDVSNPSTREGVVEAKKNLAYECESMVQMLEFDAN